jgi:hypothetical protein
VEPQQPELRRSELGATDDRSAKTKIEVDRADEVSGRSGPVPEDNQAGHHPDHEQDKPVEAMAEALGTKRDDEAGAT